MAAYPSESMKEACKDVEEAWAVDGTPADAVMLALHSPLLKVWKELCASIERVLDKCVSWLTA